MNALKRFIAAVALSFFALYAGAGAQTPAASAPLVTASATDERLRLVAPGSVVQLRLEV